MPDLSIVASIQAHPDQIELIEGELQVTSGSHWNPNSARYETLLQSIQQGRRERALAVSTCFARWFGRQGWRWTAAPAESAIRGDQ